VEVTYNSKSNNQGEKCHNVVSINKRSKGCDVTYINFVVCSLGLASQEVDVFVKSTNEML
jgi:hypothetical protein